MRISIPLSSNVINDIREAALYREGHYSDDVKYLYDLNTIALGMLWGVAACLKATHPRIADPMGLAWYAFRLVRKMDKKGLDPVGKVLRVKALPSASSSSRKLARA